MTMSRAFDALEALGLGTRKRRGRERVLLFEARGRDLWTAARPHLRSPVRRRIVVDRLPSPDISHSLAGESALAEYTMLAKPKLKTLAVPQADWSAADTQGREVDVPYPDNIEIEVWNYAPTQLSKSGIVDQLSLILSFGPTPDPRVEITLTELEEQIEW